MSDRRLLGPTVVRGVDLGPALEALERVRAEARRLRDLPRAVNEERQGAAETAEGAKATLRELYAAKEPDPRAVKRATDDVTKTQAAAAQLWELRLEGAQRAAERARPLVAEHVESNADALASDALAAADRAGANMRDAITVAVIAVGDAYADWRAVGELWGVIGPALDAQRPLPAVRLSVAEPQSYNAAHAGRHWLEVQRRQFEKVREALRLLGDVDLDAVGRPVPFPRFATHPELESEQAGAPRRVRRGEDPPETTLSAPQPNGS